MILDLVSKPVAMSNWGWRAYIEALAQSVDGLLRPPVRPYPYLLAVALGGSVDGVLGRLLTDARPRQSTQWLGSP